MNMVRKINTAHTMTKYVGKQQDMITHVLLKPEDIERLNERFSPWYPIMYGDLVKGFNHDEGWKVVEVSPIRKLTKEGAKKAETEGWQSVIWR